jgi:hypothetical protein
MIKVRVSYRKITFLLAITCIHKTVERKLVSTNRAEILVDGDTVTVFHNNEVLVSRLFVSNHPYRIVVPLNPNAPVHEFVLVANNLGYSSQYCLADHRSG